MRVRWLLILMAVVLAGAAARVLWLHWKGRTIAPAQEQNTATTKAAREVTLTGNIRPQHVVRVKAEIDGDIDSLMVDVGEDVIAGQVVAQVGSSALESERDAAAQAASAAEAQVSRAQLNLANARLEASRADADRQRSQTSLDKAQAVYDRQDMLNQAGATPRLTWEKAQHDLQNARREYEALEKASRLSADAQQTAANDFAAAQKAAAERNQELAAAQDNLRASEVRAPVDGIVAARSGELGKPAGNDLFEIATDMSALEVSLEAAPEVLQHLKIGNAALISIPGMQNAVLAGRIREIKDQAVIVEFNCTLTGVRPGMPVEARLKLQ